MPNLTCPYPENINPLLSNGFMLTIDRLPELKYFCQSASIPQISLPTTKQANPFSDVNLPGEKIEYESFNVNFMIDENMNNYIAVHNWMVGLGFPKNNQQYMDFLRTSLNNLSESAKAFSDGILNILGHNYITVRTLKFTDMFPVALSSVEFASTNIDSQPMIGSATFIYTTYEFI